MDELREIPTGWPGTNVTVDAVYQLVNEGITDPLVVREARKIVINVPERDQAAESRAISAYVRRHLRYTRESVETLTSPHEMVEQIHEYGKFTGDCDDAVILHLTLHKAIGIPVRAKVISQRRDKIATHIYGQVLVNGRWITDDTIVRTKGYGWEPPGATKEKAYGVLGLGGEMNCEPTTTPTIPVRVNEYGAIEGVGRFSLRKIVKPFGSIFGKKKEHCPPGYHSTGGGGGGKGIGKKLGKLVKGGAGVVALLGGT